MIYFSGLRYPLKHILVTLAFHCVGDIGRSFSSTEEIKNSSIQVNERNSNNNKDTKQFSG